MPHFFSPVLQRGNGIHSCYFLYCTVLFVLLAVGCAAQAAEEDSANEKVVINGFSYGLRVIVEQAPVERN